MRSLYNSDKGTMTRRQFICLGVGAVVAVGTAGCSDRKPAPRAARLNRESCQHCGMLITDPRYVSEIWDTDYKRVRIYDDFGCAVLAARSRDELEREDIGFWVTDETDPSRWLDARSAHYRAGVTTPMGYGHAAGQGERYPLDFATASIAIFENSLCVGQS